LPVPGSLALPLKSIGVPSGAIATLVVAIDSGGIASGDSTRIAHELRRATPPLESLFAPCAKVQFQLPSAAWLRMKYFENRRYQSLLPKFTISGSTARAASCQCSIA
jgi:hypothetical protein